MFEFSQRALINLSYECWIALSRFFHRDRQQAHFVVLLGGPGAGKGTVAEQLAPRLNVPHLNMGKIIDREFAGNQDFKRRWEDIKKSGLLIPDDAILPLLTAELRKKEYWRGAVLDGFPRTLTQGKYLRRQLAAWGNRIDVAICINVGEEDLIERMSLRRSCSSTTCHHNYHLKFLPPAQDGICDACGSALVEREDQKPEALVVRLREFNRTVAPLKLHFADQKCLVDVVSSNEMGPDKVFEDVVFAVDEVG